MAATSASSSKAFEWVQMMHRFYPYYWGRKKNWAKVALLADDDPQFAEFMKAGAARVVVSVRPGFELAVAHFLETGQIWEGGDPPAITSPTYLNIIDEIKERTGAEGDENSARRPLGRANSHRAHQAAQPGYSARLDQERTRRVGGGELTPFKIIRGSRANRASSACRPEGEERPEERQEQTRPQEGRREEDGGQNRTSPRLPTRCRPAGSARIVRDLPRAPARKGQKRGDLDPGWMKTLLENSNLRVSGAYASG